MATDLPCLLWLWSTTTMSWTKTASSSCWKSFKEIWLNYHQRSCATETGTFKTAFQFPPGGVGGRWLTWPNYLSPTMKIWGVRPGWPCEEGKLQDTPMAWQVSPTLKRERDSRLDPIFFPSHGKKWTILCCRDVQLVVMHQPLAWFVTFILLSFSCYCVLCNSAYQYPGWKPLILKAWIN